MKVNKKKLAEIFNVDPRTIERWQSQGLPCVSGGGNMVAQGNVLPVLYGEMRVGSRVVSQEISTADEGDGGQVVVIGR
ncbi:TPA: hypothetical protein JLK76_003077 [Escherichia coli]|nr:hypothetical protein [Escherichia coli]